MILSSKLILIFKFSKINSVLLVLFATIPPTFAAAFTIKLGFTFKIRASV